MRANSPGKIKLKIYNHFHNPLQQAKAPNQCIPKTTECQLHLQLAPQFLLAWWSRDCRQPVLPQRLCAVAASSGLQHHMWMAMNSKIMSMPLATFSFMPSLKSLQIFKKRTSFYSHLKRTVDELLSKHILLRQFQIIEHHIAEVSKTCIQKIMRKLSRPSSTGLDY